MLKKNLTTYWIQIKAQILTKKPILKNMSTYLQFMSTNDTPLQCGTFNTQYDTTNHYDSNHPCNKLLKKHCRQ